MKTKMTEVKLNCGFDTTETVFTMEFWSKPLDGEKLDKENTDNCIHQIEFELTELPENIYVPCEAGRHGLKQKLADNLAMTKELKETTTVEDAAKLTNELWEQLKSGKWNAGKKERGTTIKLDDMAKKFVAGVEAGIMEREQAITMYFTLTGKKLELPEVE